MPRQEQIALHHCVQGWSGIGKWAGVGLLDILERAQPLPEARFVLCTSDGLDQFTSGGQPRRPFYEVIDLELARRPHTILAYDFNGEPLPLPHGAPLRLRVETELGYNWATMFYGSGAEI
jgi:methionine sulfoxide reductase catalytic subunit